MAKPKIWDVLSTRAKKDEISLALNSPYPIEWFKHASKLPFFKYVRIEQWDRFRVRRMSAEKTSKKNRQWAYSLLRMHMANSLRGAKRRSQQAGKVAK